MNYETLAWPIVALVSIFIFKKDIADLLHRIKNVGKDGINLNSMPEKQNEKQVMDINEELNNIETSEVIKITEDKIYEDLKERKLDTSNDTTKLLVRHLAITQVSLDYEKIYNFIFGTQITFLRRLNEVMVSGTTQEYVESYFINIQDNNDGFKEWNLEQYLSFLNTNQLITIDGKVYHISKKGHDFLLWLIKTGHNETKAL